MDLDINGKMNKKKLLHKTTQSFLIYAVVILLVSAPVFYFVSQWLYVYETEEVLQFIRSKKWNNSVLLMMSSGNFDGINYEALGEELSNI